MSKKSKSEVFKIVSKSILEAMNNKKPDKTVKEPRCPEWTPILQAMDKTYRKSGYKLVPYDKNDYVTYVKENRYGWEHEEKPQLLNQIKEAEENQNYELAHACIVQVQAIDEYNKLRSDQEEAEHLIQCGHILGTGYKQVKI